MQINVLDVHEELWLDLSRQQGFLLSLSSKVLVLSLGM